MLRVAFLLIVAVAVALTMWQLIPNPGSVEIEWGGYKVVTSALFMVILFAGSLVIALPLLRLIMFLMDAPGRIGKASKRARTRRGQESLALGLIAAEAGEF